MKCKSKIMAFSAQSFSMDFCYSWNTDQNPLFALEAPLRWYTAYPVSGFISYHPHYF